ncbi:MAG: DUF5702 domain-containing protein [Clostridium sp.]|nr:DUF5702 domain-containing protein [Clostridium sp.]
MAAWEKKQKKKSQAYLTVYLALTMTVLLSLCLILIEGARKNAIRLGAECAVDAGMNSIMAEYHRELLEQYNLFAVDASYGTEYGSKVNTEQHLKQYVERNLSSENIFLSNFLYKDFLAVSLNKQELTKVSIYTDGEGTVFRKCAVEAIKSDVGLTLLEELMQWMETVEGSALYSQDKAAEKQQADARIEEMIDDAEEEWSEVDEETGEIIEVHIDFENPTVGLDMRRNEGILQWTVSNPESLSVKTLAAQELIMERMKKNMVNQGNIKVEPSSAGEELLERFFFQEYLLRYMGHYHDEDESDALLYQMEYLVVGKDCDMDNLRSVANRLCLMREAANALYLFSDAEKCGEAEALAASIAALILLPEIEPLLKTSLLLAWSYAESLYDVKTLLEGGRVPLIKTAETWHYSLLGALEGALPEDAETSVGLSYEDYLRIFMMLTDLNTLTGRAMNLVEADIRNTPGNSHFRLDNCYARVEAVFHMKSAYGYECEITRKAYY